MSLTTLMNERMSIGARLATGFPEMFEFCNNLMTEDGLAIDDRAVRSKLATWAVKASGLKYTSYRAISALSQGERPGPENSIGKLVAGTMLQDIATFAMDLQGAAGVLTGEAEEVARGQFQQMLLRSPSMRIAGGTDEILRNIIAERVLGLPGDIRVDKDVPFNKIPTKGAHENAGRRRKPHDQRYQHASNGSVCWRSLLHERYSCRAFQARSGAARDHRSHPARRAAHRVVVQQPAVAGRDRERRGQGALSRGDLCARPAPAPRKRRLSVSARISRRLSRAAPRKRFPALQRARHRRAATRRLTPNRRWRITISSARRMWRSSHSTEALGVYGAIDCGGYVSNFMLAAQALGLGTIPQAALARHSDLVRESSRLGDDRRVVCGISFGFPDRDHKINSYRTSRASVGDAATFVERVGALASRRLRTQIGYPSEGPGRYVIEGRLPHRRKR